MSYTVGEFANALNGISQTLGEVAEKLKLCDPNVEIGKIPGRSPICQGPIIAGAACMTAIKDPFIVADLIETVEGLKGWVLDVETKLSLFAAETPFDGGVWNLESEDVESA